MVSRMWVCNVCGKVFMSYLQCTQHRRTHSVFRPYICSDGRCIKSFCTLSHYQGHHHLHSDYRPYKCDLCRKHFLSRLHLRDHRCSKEIKVYSCYICSVKFHRILSLSSHIVREHSQTRVCPRTDSHERNKSFKHFESRYKLKKDKNDGEASENADDEFDKDADKILLKIKAGKSMTIISPSKQSSQESKKRHLKRKTKKKHKRNEKDNRKDSIILSIKNGSVNFPKKKKSHLSMYKPLEKINGVVNRVIEPVREWSNLKLKIKMNPEPSASPTILEQMSKSPATNDLPMENVTPAVQSLSKLKKRNGVVIHKDKSGNFLSEQLQSKSKKKDRENVFDSFTDIGVWKVTPSPRTDSPLEVLKLRLSPQKPLRLEPGSDSTFESAKCLDISMKAKIDNSGEDSDLCSASPINEKEMENGMHNVNDSGIEVLSSSSCNRSNGNSVRSVALDESSPIYSHTEDSLLSFDSPLTEMHSKVEHTICHKCGGIIMEANNNTRSPGNCRCNFSNPNSPFQTPVSPVKSNLLSLDKSIEQCNMDEKVKLTSESKDMLENDRLMSESDKHVKDIKNWNSTRNEQMDEGGQSDSGDSDIMIINMIDSESDNKKLKVVSKYVQNRSDGQNINKDNKLRLKLRPRQASDSPNKKVNIDRKPDKEELSKTKFSGSEQCCSNSGNKLKTQSVVSPVIVIDADEDVNCKIITSKQPLCKVFRSLSSESENSNKDNTSVKKKPLFKPKRAEQNAINSCSEMASGINSKDILDTSLPLNEKLSTNKKPLFKKRAFSECEESSNALVVKNNKKPIFKKRNSQSLSPEIKSDSKDVKLKAENQLENSVLCNMERAAHSINSVKHAEEDTELKFQQFGKDHQGLVSSEIIEKSFKEQSTWYKNKVNYDEDKSKSPLKKGLKCNKISGEKQLQNTQYKNKTDDMMGDKDTHPSTKLKTEIKTELLKDDKKLELPTTNKKLGSSKVLKENEWQNEINFEMSDKNKNTVKSEDGMSKQKLINEVKTETGCKNMNVDTNLPLPCKEQESKKKIGNIREKKQDHSNKKKVIEQIGFDEIHFENKLQMNDKNDILEFPPNKMEKGCSETIKIGNVQSGSTESKKLVEAVFLAADEDSLQQLPIIEDESISVPTKPLKSSNTSPLDLFQQQFLSFLSSNQPPHTKDNSKKLSKKRKNTEHEKLKCEDVEQEEKKKAKSRSDAKVNKNKTSEEKTKHTNLSVKEKKSDTSMSWLKIFSQDEGNESKKKFEDTGNTDEATEFTDDLALINKKMDISDQEENSLDVDDVFESEKLSILQPKEEVHAAKDIDTLNNCAALISNADKRRPGRPQKAKRSNPKLCDTISRPQKAKRSNPKLSDTVYKHRHDSDSDFSYYSSDADTLDLISCNGNHSNSDPDFNPYHDSDEDEFAPAKLVRRRESIRRKSKQIFHGNSDEESKETILDENHVNVLERTRRTKQGRKSCCPCCLGSPRKSSRDHHSHRHRKQNYKLPRNYKQFVKSTVKLLELQGKIHELFLTLFPDCVDLITKSKIGTEEFEMLIDDVLYGLENTEIPFEPTMSRSEVIQVQPCKISQVNNCHVDDIRTDTVLKKEPHVSPFVSDMSENNETDKFGINFKSIGIEKNPILSTKIEEKTLGIQSRDKIQDKSFSRQLKTYSDDLKITEQNVCESQLANDPCNVLTSRKLYDKNASQRIESINENSISVPGIGNAASNKTFSEESSFLTEAEDFKIANMKNSENLVSRVSNIPFEVESSLPDKGILMDCEDNGLHSLQNNHSNDLTLNDFDEFEPIECILESELTITIDLNAARVSLCRDPKNCLQRLHGRLIKLAHCLLPKLEFKNYFFKNIDNLEFLLDLMIKANRDPDAVDSDSDMSRYDDASDILKSELTEGPNKTMIEAKVTNELIDNDISDCKSEENVPLLLVDEKSQELFEQAIKSCRESLKKDVFDFEEDDTDKIMKNSEVITSIESLNKIAKRNRRSRDSRLRKRNADEKRKLFVQEKIQNSHNSTIVCHTKKNVSNIDSKPVNKSKHPENSKERFLSGLSLGDTLGSSHKTVDGAKDSVKKENKTIDIKMLDETDKCNPLKAFVEHDDSFDVKVPANCGGMELKVSSMCDGTVVAIVSEIEDQKKESDGSSETRRKSGDKNIFELMQPSQAAETPSL